MKILSGIFYRGLIILGVLEVVGYNGKGFRTLGDARGNYESIYLYTFYGMSGYEIIGGCRYFYFYFERGEEYGCLKIF